MRKRRVIVYEDEEIMRDLYQTFLTSMNYEVLIFSEPGVCSLYSGSSETCLSTHPCADALITDYFMPRMNGVELLQAQFERGCKLTPRNKALVSGDVDRELIQPILHLGCAYFQKPFPLSELADWLSVCERRIDIETPLAKQRKEQRFPYMCEILCRVRKQSMILRAVCVNISRSGLCLRLPLALDQEDVIELPLDRSLPSASGLVRWVKKLDDGMYLTGLQCA
jgi:CheY-like chemotaxis protein